MLEEQMDSANDRCPLEDNFLQVEDMWNTWLDVRLEALYTLLSNFDSTKSQNFVLWSAGFPTLPALLTPISF